MERRIRAFFHPSSEILQLSLCRSLYTNLCPRADSRNAIKTGKRGLTFREISLLLSLSCKSGSLHRLVFPQQEPPLLSSVSSPSPSPSPPIIIHCFPFGKVERRGQRFFFLIFNSRYATRTHIFWVEERRPVQLHGNERKSVGRRVNFDDTGKGWLSNRRVRETELN